MHGNVKQPERYKPLDHDFSMQAAFLKDSVLRTGPLFGYERGGETKSRVVLNILSSTISASKILGQVEHMHWLGDVCLHGRYPL